MENAKAWLYTNGIVDISVTGGSLEISGDPNDAAGKQFGNIWYKMTPGAISEKQGTLQINLQDTTVRASDTVAGSAGASSWEPLSGVIQGENISITNSTVKAVRTYDDGVTRDGLITIKGASLKLKKKGTDGSDPSHYEYVGDSLTLSGASTEVYANVEVENITLKDGATLITNQIGHDTPLSPSVRNLTSLTMDGNATISMFTGGGNKINCENTLDIVLREGQTIIHNTWGFRSFTLNGGVVGGDLYGSLEDDSTITLTSGEHTGGEIGDTGKVIIDGPVRLKPAYHQLASVSETGETKQFQGGRVRFIQPVTIKSSGNPVLYKLYDLQVHPTPRRHKYTLTPEITLEKDAQLTFMLDLEESSIRRQDTYLEVTKTLRAEGNNQITAKASATDADSLYRVKQSLYNSWKSGTPVIPFTVITTEQGIINGENLSAGSSDPFFSVTGAVVDGKEYQLTPAYNPDPTPMLLAEGLSSNEAAVVAAAQTSALEAGSTATLAATDTTSIGARMDQAIAAAGHSKTAEMNQWDAHNGSAATAVTVQNKAGLAVNRHLNAVRQGSKNTGSGMFTSLYSGISPSMYSGTNTRADDGSQNFWGEYLYNDGKMDAHDGQRSYDTEIQGITVGYDTLISDQLTLGFAFTYSDSKTKTKDVGRSTDSKACTGTLYTGWTQDNYFVDTQFSYSYGNNDYKRRGLDTSYKADGDSSVWGIRVLTGYNFQKETWSIQPLVELNYANAKLDSFKEKGTGDWAEKVEMSDYEVMELGAGIRLTADCDTDNGKLIPEFFAMAYHDFKDDKAKTEGTFLNGGGHYVVTGASREQNRFVAGVGISYKTNSNLQMGLHYDHNWSSDFKANGFTASLRYDF